MKSDVFVSYAHVDNERYMGIDHGWVSNLYRELRDELQDEVDFPVHFASRWAEVHSIERRVSQCQTQSDLEQATVLLVVLSPGYMESKMCLQELQHFRSRIDTTTDFPHPRIIVVEKRRLAAEDAPSEIAPYPRFLFWELDRRDRVRTLGVPQPNIEDKLYFQIVKDLARVVAATLKAARDDAGFSVTSTSSDFFLAEVTEDIADQRKELRRYLEQLGYAVKPTRGVTLSGNQEQLRTQMSNSEMFVQLLSDQSQWEGMSPATNWARVQYDAALACSVPVLQWQSPELEPHPDTTAVQRELLELETVTKMRFEDFKDYAVERLAAEFEPSLGQSRFVYLNVAQQDNRLARQIGRVVGQLGIEWHMRLTDGSATQIREDMEFRLTNCEALIVIYGEISAAWVETQLRYFQLQVRKLRDRPLRAIGLYEGPPDAKAEVAAPTPDLRILNCRLGMNEESLRDFLAPLLRSG